MNINRDDYFQLGKKKYITLDKTRYLGLDYIFVNELDDNENPTNKFRIYKLLEKGIIEETNQKIIEPLKNHFSYNLGDNIIRTFQIMNEDNK